MSEQGQGPRSTNRRPSKDRGNEPYGKHTGASGAAAEAAEEFDVWPGDADPDNVQEGASEDAESTWDPVADRLVFVTDADQEEAHKLYYRALGEIRAAAHPAGQIGRWAPVLVALAKSRCLDFDQVAYDLGDLARRRGLGQAFADNLVDELWDAVPGVLPDEVDTPSPLPADQTRRAKDVERRAEQLRVDAEAKQRVAAEKRAARPVEPPELVALDAFLAEPDDPVEYRIEGLMVVGGRVVLAAQNKVGKTTLVGNTIRCLVDGDPLLDRFEVQPVGRVVLLDAEMGERQLRRWLRDQGIQNPGAVQLVAMRGRMSQFDILDPVVRSEWAARLRGADVLVLDCLRPLMDALGLDENREAGRLLEALDALMAEAGIPELLVVHHMGHSNERSRGDSRLEDWPDAKWRLLREDPEDQASSRYFAAYGRDVDQPEVRVELQAGRRLAVVGGSRSQTRNVGLQAKVLDYVRDHPGVTQNGIETALGGNRQDVRKAIDALEDEKAIRVKRTYSKNGTKVLRAEHYVDEDDLDDAWPEDQEG